VLAIFPPKQSLKMKFLIATLFALQIVQLFALVPVKDGSMAFYRFEGESTIDKGFLSLDGDLFLAPGTLEDFRGVFHSFRIGGNSSLNSKRSFNENLESPILFRILANNELQSDSPMLSQHPHFPESYAFRTYKEHEIEDYYKIFLNTWHRVPLADFELNEMNLETKEFNNLNHFTVYERALSCNQSYLVEYLENYYIVKGTINSKSCTFNKKPVNMKFEQTIVRQFSKDGLYLNRLDVSYLQEDSTYFNFTAKFIELVPLNEEVFQPKAKPLFIETANLYSLIPFQTYLDSKFIISGKDFQSTLFLRDSGNKEYVFGRVLNSVFTDKNLHEFLSVPFVGGVSSGAGYFQDEYKLHKTPRGRFVFKPLNQNRYEIMFRNWNSQNVYFDVILKELFRRGFNLHSEDVQNACQINYELQGEFRESYGAFEYSCVGKDAEISYKHSYKFVDGKVNKIVYEVNGEKVLTVAFDGFVPRKDNDAEIFYLYGKAVNEDFFLPQPL